MKQLVYKCYFVCSKVLTAKLTVKIRTYKNLLVPNDKLITSIPTDRSTDSSLTDVLTSHPHESLLYLKQRGPKVFFPFTLVSVCFLFGVKVFLGLLLLCTVYTFDLFAIVFCFFSIYRIFHSFSPNTNTQSPSFYFGLVSVALRELNIQCEIAQLQTKADFFPPAHLLARETGPNTWK